MLECPPDIKILFNQQDLQKRVRELGKKLTKDLEGQTPIFVAILSGAAMFHSDLVRQVNLMLTVDYISVKSYGDSTCSSGKIRILKDLESNIEGKDVVLIEDIVDSGQTISYLLKNLLTRNPRSLTLCSLLSKPARREIPIEIDYIGFEIPNCFVVGYGLDHAKKYRNLPYIGILSATD